MNGSLWQIMLSYLESGFSPMIQKSMKKIINFANFKGNVAKLWEFFIVVSKFSQKVIEKLWKYGIVEGSVGGAPDAKEILKN